MKSDLSNLEKVYEATRKILPIGELGLVGGCVRDTLLGLEPKDYDFCTNLTPDEVEELVKKAGRRAYSVDKAYGTIGFKVEILKKNDYGDEENKGGWSTQWDTMSRFVLVEVTTYRKEKYHEGSRKPEVEFGTDLREDLLRRDFTINALWFGSKDPKQKPELLDLFCGRLHLDEGLIKSVGDAQQMVKDDPLRILRAVRFKHQLGFNIDQYLWGVCKKNIKKLWDVAIERQVVELDKIFTRSTLIPGDNLRDLGGLGYIKQFLPELLTENLEETKVPNNPDPDEAWAALLSTVGAYVYVKDGEIKRNFLHKRHDFLCKGIASRFKFSNRRLETILGGE